MLCNPEKMPITEWPHPQIEQRGVPAMPASTKALMERSTTQDQQQPQQQPPQQPLKCPRCDSSNTKFCYYNNYSLSQPRHFCKACKRYWTRGGTLRNVPVGGGCRKNKRVKRPAAASGSGCAAAEASSLPGHNPSSPRLDTASVYGLAAGAAAPPADMGPLAFPALRSLSLENMNVPISSSSSPGFDLPHLWMNSFPAAGVPTTTTTTTSDAEYQFNPNPSPSSLLPDFSLLGSSASSILASTLHNPKLGMAGFKETRPCNDFQVFFPMGGLHQNGGPGIMKGVKMEEESVNTVGNKMGWYDNSSMENNVMGSDSSVYNWSSTAAWPDATNYGSSITPLI